MTNKKDDVVNKAIKFTRSFRPIEFNEKTGEPLVDNWSEVSVDKKSLLDLCLSIQKFLYGEEDNGK